MDYDPFGNRIKRYKNVIAITLRPMIEHTGDRLPIGNKPKPGPCPRLRSSDRNGADLNGMALTHVETSLYNGSYQFGCILAG